MIEMIIPALISGAASAASGIASGNASAKQSRLAMIQHAMTEEANRKELERINTINEYLGRELLATPMTVTNKVTTNTKNNSTSAGDVDYEGMMKAAEASGINPITFIRNGGLAAFARTKSSSDTTVDVNETQHSVGHNAVAAFQLMSPAGFQASAGPQQVIGSNAAAIAGGVQQAADTFIQQMNRQNTQDFQRELLATQLAGINKSQERVPGGRSFYVPGFSTSGSITKNAGTGGLSALPIPSSWEQGDVKITNPYSKRMVDTTSPDAAAAEERYGEIGGSLFGLRTAMDDFWLNVTGLNADQRKDKFWKPVGTFLGGLPPLWRNPSEATSGASGAW